MSLRDYGSTSSKMIWSTHRDEDWLSRIVAYGSEHTAHVDSIRLVGRWYALGLYPEEVLWGLKGWNQNSKSPLSSEELKSIIKSTCTWIKTI